MPYQTFPIALVNVIVTSWHYKKEAKRDYEGANSYPCTLEWNCTRCKEAKVVLSGIGIFTHSTILLLQSCGITKSLQYEQILKISFLQLLNPFVINCLYILE